MKSRPLAQTGIKVSDICLGTMQFRWTTTEEESHRVMDYFFEQGGNFIDTADMYTQWAKGLKGGEAESIIGDWMKKKKNRSKVVVATKTRCRMWKGADGEGLSRSHIIRACDESLQRLKTDYIDLYQTHWPDPKTPIEETLSAFQSLIKQGKVRHLGCSNYSDKEMEDAFAAGEKAGAQFICVQPRYNIICRFEFEAKILPTVLAKKMAVIPYSPLEGGLLTGKYRRGEPLPESARAKGVKEKMTDRNMDVVETLEKMGKSYGKSMTQMALGWLLSHEWMTSPIIGANTPDQLKDILGATGFVLDASDKKKLDELSRGL